MPVKGQKLTEEHKRKLLKALKQRREQGNWGDKVAQALSGRSLSERHRRNVSNGLGLAWKNGRVVSEKSRKLASERMSILAKSQVGNKHPRWIHDRSTLIPYKSRPQRHLDWANSIKRRDNFQCALAFSSPCEGCLEAHHIWSPIVRPERRYDLTNGITLCKKHHPRKRSVECRLRSYFEQKIKDVMQINVADVNVIGETDAVIFSFIHQSSTDVQMFLSNLGDNTLNYHFQQNVNGTWTDLSAIVGPDPAFDNQYLTGTLTSGQTRSIHLVTANPQVRLMSNASGGSSLWFQVSRFAVRGDGGALPILNL